MSRVANSSSSLQDMKTAVQAVYWQLASALQLPVYVWVGMVLLAAAGLCYSLTVHTRAELRMARSEYQQINQDVKRLGIENARLEQQLRAVENDPRTIETLAREAGMVATGESVLLLENRPQAGQRK